MRFGVVVVAGGVFIVFQTQFQINCDTKVHYNDAKQTKPELKGETMHLRRSTVKTSQEIKASGKKEKTTVYFDWK